MAFKNQITPIPVKEPGYLVSLQLFSITEAFSADDLPFIL